MGKKQATSSKPQAATRLKVLLISDAISRALNPERGLIALQNRQIHARVAAWSLRLVAIL
jgi:hypothetical protein